MWYAQSVGSVTCQHPKVAESRCLDCGTCVHEIVLNGACYFCGATDIQVTVRPAEPPVVPADRLRKAGSGKGPGA